MFVDCSKSLNPQTIGLTKEDGAKAERAGKPVYCFLMACSVSSLPATPLCSRWGRGCSDSNSDFRLLYKRKQNILKANCQAPPILLFTLRTLYYFTTTPCFQYGTEKSRRGKNNPNLHLLPRCFLGVVVSW